jgi:4-alpha-glucanotransferase
LYDWEAHRESGYKWWIERLKCVLSQVDVVRIDHFRGFEAYWSIPFGSVNAVKGKWVKGPGRDFFLEIEKKLGKARIIAEDLGVITAEVTAIRKDFGFPGMKILQFGMEGAPESLDLPYNFEDSHTVAYTGTHDNDTTLGWYKSSAEKIRDYFRRYMNVSGDSPPADLIRLMFASNAKWVLAPIQDVFGLGTEDRMNLPGTPTGNWQFRFTEDMMTEEAAHMLRYLSDLFGRNILAKKKGKKNDS